MVGLSAGKSTTRHNRRGDEEKKVSLWMMDPKVHEKVANMAGPGWRIYDIYSTAVSIFRKDCDSESEEDILLQTPTGDLKKVQIWLINHAYEDMLYLEKKMKTNHTTVVYTAMMRYFDRQRSL